MRYLLPILVLFFAIAAYLFFRAATPIQGLSNTEPSQDWVEETVAAEKKASMNLATTEPNANSGAPCTRMEEFVSGPDGYRLDSWFMSWGAPAIASSSDAWSAYAWYDDMTLDELSKSEDAGAKQVLGRRMVISSLTGVTRPPLKSTIWDVGSESLGLELAETIDIEKLSEGRELLYDSAVLGRTYALIEIAISYAFERQARSAIGNLNSEEYDKFVVNTFAYGEAAEGLVPVLHSGYYQSTVPKELLELATLKREEIISGISHERRLRGVASNQFDDTTADTLRSLNICND